MIIIPSGTGIPSRFHVQSEEVMDEQNTEEEDDDIHICGTCKTHFTDIFLFMRHKSESTCSSRLSNKLMSVIVPSNTPPSGSNPMFSSLGDTNISSIRPETKYTRVALIDSEAFTIQKGQIMKGESTDCQEEVEPSLSVHPAHLVLADSSSQVSDIQNQDETTIDKSEMTLEDDWDSSWSAAKVLGTFSLSNSLKRFHHGNLSILKEDCGTHEQENNVNVNSEGNSVKNPSGSQQDHLESCGPSSVLMISQGKHKLKHVPAVEDSQAPDRIIGPHGGFLDVEDVEVATLLANHLANEPSLHIYPNSTESFLSYDNIPTQLVITEPTEHLHFGTTSGKDKELSEEEKKQQEASLSSKSGKLLLNESLSKEIFISESTAQITREETAKGGKKRKVHSCPNEGCKFQGNSVRDLNRHIRKHTGERPFKCPECEKTFTRRDKLSVHQRCHGGAKTFQCKVCEFSCRDQSGLVIHMRRHNDERPYKCQICEHRTRTKSHLNVHLRKHTGDHPYKCKKCGRAFTTSSDLTRHSRLHSGDKPYSCPHCTYSAALKTSLRTHIQQNHLSGIPLDCPKCNIQCQSRKDLRSHLKSHKGDPKHCSKCDFTCATNTALKNHLKIHVPEKAKPSPLLNGRKGLLRSHQKKKLSPKKQKKMLEDYPEVHNCAYCNMTFWREDTLEEHVRQHQLEELVSVRSPAPQDPVLADSADSRDSTDSTCMDVTCGLAGLAALASFHSASDHTSGEQQPAFLYRYTSNSQSNDNLRNAEILASLNQGSGALPQYVAIQTEQNTLVDALNCIQYVLPSPLGTLDDNDNATSLLC